MRVFVTGASGHIGSATVPELLSAGHEVVGLARSEASAAKIKALGADVVLGDLDDLDGLRAAASAADGVIHLAFKHELMLTGDFEGPVEADLAAINAFGDALAGTDKPFVGTSGTLMAAGPGKASRASTEDDAADEASPRSKAEVEMLALAERSVRASFVRLPPIVHSDRDYYGFVTILIGFARQRGFAGYLGDGTNRWPSVHTLDAARIYRHALEKAPAGTRVHAVGDEGIPFRELAENFGRHLNVPVGTVAEDDVAAQFGFLAQLAGIDNPTSGARSRELLGWQPTEPGLLADLDLGHYYETK